MLIAAAALAVALAVSAAAGASIPPATSLPPIVVKVVADPGIAADVVNGALAEADAVWRDTGVRFLWQREDRRGPAHAFEAAVPFGPGPLRVVIGHDRHSAPDLQLPLGWIVFDGPAMPARDIYVSYSSAVSLLDRSRGIAGAADEMPLLKRELLLSRAMGRALAHEIGHYLSASKVHTPTGLMMAVHSAADFFGADPRRFRIDPSERARMLARITSIYMASRG